MARWPVAGPGAVADVAWRHGMTAWADQEVCWPSGPCVAEPWRDGARSVEAGVLLICGAAMGLVLVLCAIWSAEAGPAVLAAVECWPGQVEASRRWNQSMRWRIEAEVALCKCAVQGLLRWRSRFSWRLYKDPKVLSTGGPFAGTNLELAGVVWRSSWWLESRRSSIPSSSSSPVHLLRPAQTTFLKPIKGSGADPVNATARCVAFRGDYEAQEEEQVEDGNASE
ncbi:hypothetical protein Taro_042345 [Colocasia esculenta]|uniref:Uncharacterized protein n=1 Tax=Colocasia esculenta TaxID=4460 RepID=A0A843X2E2_COLES|nr:hypothetical protein [Colocasia esculenta]